MRRLTIEDFLKESANALILDVRSPGEYSHAHIPGAISFPLFTDKERKVVGTTYKQQSREAAIKIGLEYFGPKMRGMVEEVERLVSSRQYTVCSQAEANNTAHRLLPTAYSVFIYCWRGGMRSGAVAWLLNLYGFNVTVLNRGYKAFRNYVLESFQQPYSFKILGGYTGSGKTEVLQELEAKGETIIDLEKFASHKGSAFGNINMPSQPTQEMFENKLSCELLAASYEQGKASGINSETTTNHKQQTTNSIWLEDESQRIGNLNIPNALWQTMRTSPVYFLNISFEERLQHLSKEYGQCAAQMLADAIQRIKKRLGPFETKMALQYLEEDNITECFRILLHYYDKQYLKGLHNRQNLDALITKIECAAVETNNAGLVLQATLMNTNSYAGKN